MAQKKQCRLLIVHSTLEISLRVKAERTVAEFSSNCTIVWNWLPHIQMRNKPLVRRNSLSGGTRDILTKRELRRLAHEGPKLPFFKFREHALKILRDVDDDVVGTCMSVCQPISDEIMRLV